MKSIGFLFAVQSKLSVLLALFFFTATSSAYTKKHMSMAEEWPLSEDYGSSQTEGLQALRMTSINILGGSQPRTQVKKKFNREAENVFKVLIDPGHGGKDHGAQGYFGILEKHICLKIGHLIKREIEKTVKRYPLEVPLEVSLTREGDEFLNLKERVRVANDWGADLFVSVHANSSPVKRARGFEVYFLNAEATDEETTKLARLENAEHEMPLTSTVFSILSDVQANQHVNTSAKFAEALFGAMSTAALTQARAVRQGPFTVLHGTTMPAVLIEVGYVTNLEDAHNLSKENYLKQLANAISSGIIEFASRRKKVG